MKTNTLFAISETYLEIVSKAEAQDGEVDIQTLSELESIVANLDQKVDNYLNLIKLKDMENDAISQEIKRLQARKKRNEAVIDFLKDNLKENLEKLGLNKLQTELNTIRIQNNPPAVNILDEKLIPEDFKKTIITVEVDKKAILIAIKNGETVDGASITQGKSLRIS